jgi:hypothetical protein
MLCRSSACCFWSRIPSTSFQASSSTWRLASSQGWNAAPCSVFTQWSSSTERMSVLIAARSMTPAMGFGPVARLTPEVATASFQRSAWLLASSVPASRAYSSIAKTFRLMNSSA